MQQCIAAGEIDVEDCLYINFEDEHIRYISATELELRLDCYAEMVGDHKLLFYLDEIQVIDGWSSLYAIFPTSNIVLW